jgi:TetR/AcrR family transcriptional repressor of nem operon
MGKQSFLRLLEPDASLEHIRQIFSDRVADLCCTEERKGCLFIHTAMGLAPQDDDLHEVLQKFMQRIAKLFAIGLESAKAKGEVREDLNTARAGEFLASQMFGLAVLGRTGFSREALDGIVDTTLASLRA